MGTKASIGKTIRRRFIIPRFDLHRFLRWVLVVILYLITFSALDQLTHTLQLLPGVVVWYPPDGLSLAFLLTFGAGFAPVFALASLISSLIIYRFSTPLGPLLVWAVILSAGYGIDAFILRRRIRIDPQLKNLRDILWLILSSTIVSTILAVIAVSTLVNYGEVPSSQYFNALFEWWIGEMIGVLVFTPFLLTHGMPWVKQFIKGDREKSKKPTVFHRPSLQSIGQVISIPVILYLAFGIPALRSFQLLYLLAGPLIWISLTNGFSGVSLAILVMNLGTILAIWLFKFDTSRLGELQFLMFGIYASTLLSGVIVTKQKRTEQELRQREIHNRALIENAPDAITLLGTDGLLKYLSPSTQQILGYAPQEQVGSNPAELTHPDDLPALLKLLDDLSQEPGKVVTTQYRFRHKDGSWRWLESTITNLLTEPSVQAIVFNFRDVTERKQAVETLQKSENRFRALVEHSLEEISLVNSDGTLTWESPTLRRPLGYPPNSFVGHNLFELFHPDDRAAATRLLEQIGKHPGSVQEASFRLRHQDGSWHWMEGILTNLIDEPAVQSVVINYRDVTERKQAESEITSLAKFPSENPNPVLRLSRDGILMYANSASDKLLGLWGCAVGGTAPQFWRDQVGQVLASKENKTVDIECDKKVYSMVVTPVTELGYVNIYGRDITERKQAEENLHDSREELYRLLNSIVEGAYGVDTNGNCTFVNRTFFQILGFQNDQELLGKHIHELIHHSHSDGSPYPSSECKMYRAHQTNQPINVSDEVFWRKDGVAIPVEYWSRPIVKDGVVIGSIATFIDITERKQAEEAIRLSEEKYRTLVDEVNDGFYVTDEVGVFTLANSALARMYGVEGPQILVGRKYSDFVAPDMPVDNGEAYRSAMQSGYTPEVINGQVLRPDGTRAFIEIKPTMIVTGGQIVGTRGVVRDVTQRKQAEEEIKISNDELSMLFELSHSLAGADNLDDILDLVNRHAVESIHTTFARIALFEDGNYIIRAAYPIRVLDHDLRIGERNPTSSLPFSHRVLEQKEPLILRASDPEINIEEKKALLLDFAQSLCLIPLRISDSSLVAVKLMGLLMLGEARNESREPFTPEKIRLAQTIGDSAAIAIRRMLLREQTERHLQQLVALSEIDLAIISSSDMVFSLGVLLLQAIEQLKVDAADVWLFIPTSQTLEFVSGRGFRTPAFENAKPLHLGEGYAGRAALERRTIHVPNLTAHTDHPRLAKALTEEPFMSYYAVPLIVKEQVKGVLELFLRTELESNEEWLKFLHTLANQAAIAIDNSSLFNDLQQSNAELTQAYDATIQGWSRALDLRDNETEGHTQRVTELTMKLGRQFGLSEEELVHVRRGALLHDIGKMGVPDGILLKPGPLTDDEWIVMRKHTTFAYELLSPIHFLRPALDIPYCHHEKWDGTGYPRGLSGDQIPFAARIFAVVDVWDALCSDRPYRKAWPVEKVRNHIQAGSGTHFDPQVVKICLDSGLLKG